MVWLSARDHILAYNSTSIHAASSVFHAAPKRRPLTGPI